MEVFAELRSKKEIEADMSKLVSAFISLAEDLLEEKRQKKLKEAETLKVGEEEKPKTIITTPVMPRATGRVASNTGP